MAIAFAQATIHTRSKGHSAIAAAAYRAGIKLSDERTGLIHDFKKRADVNFSEVLLPEGVSDKFEDRDYLWNQLELAERRKNSQLCKDIVLALPKELDLVHHIELARRFANRHFVSNGIPADINIHDGKSDNPHAHILVPLRRLERDGFAKKKARDLNPEFAKGFIVTQDFWGEQWRDFQNDYIKEHGIDLSVDLNHVLPEEHEGRLRGKDKHYTKAQNQLVKEARRELALHDIDNFINLLSLKSSVFSRRDLERLLFKTFAGDEKHYLIAIERILAHKDTIELGLGDDGKMRFTTRHHYIQECKLFEKIEGLSKKKSHTSLRGIAQVVARFSLSQEQAEALNHVVGNGDISVVCGKPGTGKTYMLKALNQHYSNIGYRTLGTALASKAAKGLEAESGIQSSTIASLNYRIASGKLALDKKYIVVVDEAGMVDFASLNHLITAVKKAGSKIVLVGDSEQLKPIGKGDLFRGISARVGYYAMEDIKRQRDAGDRQASIVLSKGEVGAAITHYENKGALCWGESNSAMIQSAVDGWVEDIKEADYSNSVMLSFTRDAVLKLNLLAREALQEQGVLSGESKTLTVIRGDKQQFNEKEAQLESTLNLTPTTKPLIEDIHLSKGERILFKKRDNRIGVDNGDIGVITDITKLGFTAKLDDGRKVVVNNAEYKHFDYGYSLTVHKSQGMTVDNAHVVIDSPYWDKHLGFVAMTRHRENVNVYANKAQHNDKDALIATLSRAPTKDNVIDFPLDYAIRYGFEPDSIAGRAINKIAGIKNKVKQRWDYLVNYEAYLSSSRFNESTEKKGLIRKAAKNAAGYLDAQAKVSKLYREIEKNGGFEKASEALQDSFYKEGMARDRKAYTFIKRNQCPLSDIKIRGFKEENLLKASKRYEERAIIKACAYYDKDKSVSRSLGEKLAPIDLKQNHVFIKHFAKEKAVSPVTLYRSINTHQQTARKDIFEALVKESPELSKYNELSKRVSKLSGYFKEKAQKELVPVASKVLAEKTVSTKLKKSVPNMFERILQHAGRSRSRGRGLDIGV